MIKDILQGFERPIIDDLPNGAITELAEKHGFARQSITKMLKGEEGRDENIIQVLESAQEMCRRSGETGKRIRRALKKSTAKAAAKA